MKYHLIFNDLKNHDKLNLGEAVNRTGRMSVGQSIDLQGKQVIRTYLIVKIEFDIHTDGILTIVSVIPLSEYT